MYVVCWAVPFQEVPELLAEVLAIYDLRLKVLRLCEEMQSLAKHGHVLPGNMQGLTEDQVRVWIPARFRISWSLSWSFLDFLQQCV